MSAAVRARHARITEFAPGHGRFPHRTETVDYAILLSGEIDLELDSDEVVHLKPGDVVVQRGTMHTWINKGTVPAVFASSSSTRSRRRSTAKSCARTTRRSSDRGSSGECGGISCALGRSYGWHTQCLLR